MKGGRATETTNNNQPLVSVVIPVFDVERYVAQCLESVGSQTYANLEIILVDDGSTDGSGALCEEFAMRDSRAQVVHTENRGLSAARNEGIARATGDYLTFVDADDWLEPDAVRVLVDAAIRTNADMACSDGAIYEWVDRTTCPPEAEASIRIMSGTEALEALFLGTSVMDEAWGKLYARHLFEKTLFPEGRFFEDILTTHRFVASSSRVVCVPEAPYHYRIRRGSIVNSPTVHNLIDYWEAHALRFDLYGEAFPRARGRLLRNCVFAIGRALAWWGTLHVEDRRSNKDVLTHIGQFARLHAPEVLRDNYNARCRLLCALGCFPYMVVWLPFGLLNRLRQRLLHKRRMYP